MAKYMAVAPIFTGRGYPVEEDLCFVLMPFRDSFIRIYEEHVKPTLEALGFRVIKADDIFKPGPIVEQIWEYIIRSRIIIADVTERNPNVFYELGIAHTLGKDVIIITQSEEDVPFDLRHLRYFKYSDNREGWKKLKENLENAVRTIIDMSRPETPKMVSTETIDNTWLSKRIKEVAGEIAGMLGIVYGAKRVDKIFPHLSSELEGKSKTEQIYFVLSNSNTLDEFISKLQIIINVHARYLNKEENRKHFNQILSKLDLKLDDKLFISKVTP